MNTSQKMEVMSSSQDLLYMSQFLGNNRFYYYTEKGGSKLKG